MEKFTIRPFQKTDLKDLEEITYRTGDFGEDLTGKGLFNDSRLFFYLYIYYYTVFSPEYFFVVIDNESTETVAGFICGISDTMCFQNIMKQKKQYRLFFRAFFYSLMRYPESFCRYRRILKSRKRETNDPSLEKLKLEYPAHLHINIRADYQKYGLGGKLMTFYLKHLEAQHVKGVHLITTSLHEKSVPFYKKQGFKLEREVLIENHPDKGGFKELYFVKKIKGSVCI